VSLFWALVLFYFDIILAAIILSTIACREGLNII